MSRRIRELLDRLRDWWEGEPGRHSYAYQPLEAATEPIRIISVRLDPELDDAWAADALRMARAPRLYAGADIYWGQRYRDFYAWLARQTAARNEFRTQMGLGQLPVPPLPARLAAA